MKIYDYDNIFNFIKENKNINLLAFCISPWHANGVQATINCLKSNNIPVNALVIICSHTGRYLINESNFKGIEKNISVVYLKINDKNSENIHTLFVALFQHNDSSLKPFYLLYPNTIDLKLICRIKKIYSKRKIVNIMLDEGTATYLMGILGWALVKLRNKSLSFRKRILIFFKTFIYNIIVKISIPLLKINNEVIPFYTIIKKRGVCLPNWKVVNYYKEILESNIQFEEDKIYKNSVVILTQCFPNCDDENAYDIEPLYDICKMLKKREISPIIIRTHPREINPKRFEILEAIVTGDKLSFEAITADKMNRPLVVISYFSTALVNLNIFWNVKTISIYKMLSKEKFDINFYKDMKNFYKKYNKIVEFPKNIKELENIMISTVSKKKDEKIINID